MADMLRITPYAREKAKKYASLIGDREYFGFLLRPVGDEREITQEVVLGEVSKSCGSVKIGGDKIVRILTEQYEKGYEPIGWLHSHGTFSTFFSSTDTEEMENDALHDFAPVTLKHVLEAFQAKQVTENGLTKLLLGDSFEVHCKGELPEVYKKSSVARVWGYVVNADGSEHAEVVSKEFCTGCHNETVYPTKEVGVDVIELEDQKTIDEAKVKEEVDIRTKESLTVFKARKVAPAKNEKKIVKEFASQFLEIYNNQPEDTDALKNLIIKYYRLVR